MAIPEKNLAERAKGAVHEKTPFIAHFYHLWCGGEWERILLEHIESLRVTGFIQHISTVYFGLVGTSSDRRRAREVLLKSGINFTIVAEENEGYEQVTIDYLHQFSKTNHCWIYYCHNKGSYTVTPLNERWRKTMTRHNIEEWPVAFKHLSDENIDATGCYFLSYLTSELVLPGQQFFAGNFWWAKSSYLRTLPDLKWETRYEAEAWIGSNDRIRIADLYPNWPPK